MKECKQAIKREICSSFDFLDSWGFTNEEKKSIGIDYDTYELRFQEPDDEVIQC